MRSQSDKGAIFSELHKTGLFVMPNPWDAGSAKVLASLGYKALATTSAGLAFCMGKPDGKGAVTRDLALDNARQILTAVDLPISADLENGYGDSPEDCALTVDMAIRAGLAGCSIEDATGHDSNPIYAFDVSVTRIKAAVAAARQASFPFTLTARAENFLHGNTDLADTLKRLEAFADAGADVLFAPGLKTKSDIAAAVKAISPKPFNVVLNAGVAEFSLRDLEDMGVRRVSVGSSLILSAYGAFIRSAKEMKEKGTFGFVQENALYKDMNDLFG